MNKVRIFNLVEQLSLDTAFLDNKTSISSEEITQKLGFIICFIPDKPLIILGESLWELESKVDFYCKALEACWYTLVIVWKSIKLKL